jgi:hypothetical protein
MASPEIMHQDMDVAAAERLLEDMQLQARFRIVLHCSACPHVAGRMDASSHDTSFFRLLFYLSA